MNIIRLATDSSKPGRSLTQLSHEEIAGWMGVPWEQIRAPYIVRIHGGVAGNHYHMVKREVLQAVEGKGVLFLEDPKTKERQQVEISAIAENGLAQAVVIPLGVAHAALATSAPLVLLVWSTRPAREAADDFPYEVYRRR